METREERAALVLLLALTFFGLAYVAAAAEDNSSWFFSIPERGIYAGARRHLRATRRRGASTSRAERGVVRASGLALIINGAHARAVGAAGARGER